MKKIYYLWKGAIFKRFEKMIYCGIKWIAIADKKNAVNNERIHNVPVILPEHINQFDYDYISIFSSKYFDEIKIELVRKYFILELKHCIMESYFK